jgi:hypothetical protein
MMGGTLSAPTLAAILASPQPAIAGGATPTGFALAADQQALLAEIAEMISPTTKTPGAKAAGVGPFVEMMLKDCYDDRQRKSFQKGLEDVEQESKKAHDKSFVDLSNEQKTAILTEFEDRAEKEIKRGKDDAKMAGQKAGGAPPDWVETATAKSNEVDSETGSIKQEARKKNEPTTPFFALMKELTLLGYFTSEIGATKALAYVQIPGRYDGCVKLEKGQKAWAI